MAFFRWRGDQNLLKAVWTVPSHSNREEATPTDMNRGPCHLSYMEMIMSLALENRTLLPAFPFFSNTRRTDCKCGWQRIFWKAWPVQGKNKGQKGNVHLCITKVFHWWLSLVWYFQKYVWVFWSLNIIKFTRITLFQEFIKLNILKPNETSKNKEKSLGKTVSRTEHTF